MECIQINLQKALLGMVELARKLNGRESFLCLVQEPYQYKNALAGIPTGCSKIPNNMCNDPPRAAIIASNDLNLIQISELSNRDLAVGCITLGDREILVVSSYMDIRNQMGGDLFGKLMQYGRDKGIKVLIGMDSNAHT